METEKSRTTPTQPAVPRTKRVNKPIRLAPEIIARCEKIATESGHSFNAFVTAALEGIADMIETPENEPLCEPKIVAIARTLRQWEPEIVKRLEEP